MKERKGMAPFMKNVVLFALFTNFFILVSADSRCADHPLAESTNAQRTMFAAQMASVILKLASIFSAAKIRTVLITDINWFVVGTDVCLGVTAPDETVLWIPIVQLTKFAVTQNVFERALLRQTKLFFPFLLFRWSSMLSLEVCSRKQLLRSKMHVWLRLFR